MQKTLSASWEHKMPLEQRGNTFYFGNTEITSELADRPVEPIEVEPETFLDNPDVDFELPKIDLETL
jgi:hypothetical protein